jgi:hypothetical protein
VSAGMEKDMVLVKGGAEVRSVVEVEELGGGGVCVWVWSSTSEHSQQNGLTIMPRAGYGDEQLRYDVEVFRHRMAEECVAAPAKAREREAAASAKRVEVRDAHEALRQVVTEAVAVAQDHALASADGSQVVTAPRFEKPGKKG